MIYLDVIGYNFLVKEIKEEILGLKIRKIYNYDSNSFSIFFNKKNLYFENKKEPIIYLREKKLQNTDKELNFVLKLKKHIIGAIVKDVYLFNNDRIVILELEKLNLLNEVKKYKLIYELLGKSINVILTDEQDIIIATMYVNIGKRILLNGAKYEKLEAFNPYGVLMRDLDEETKEKFKASYTPLIYKDNLVTYNDFYNNKEKTYYNTLNEALEEYFEINNNVSSLETKKKPILKYIRQNIKRLNKILLKIPKDMEENKDYEKYKKIGDIIASNLYQIKDNVDKVSLYDYYEDKQIEIELDKNLSKTKNMENYYTKYTKLKRKQEVLNERYIEIKEELSYFSEQEFYTLKEDSLIGLEQIEKELGINSRNIKSTKNSKREIEKINYLGFDIYVGRNSYENEEITFKIAKKNDLWFHAKDVAGSHVLIKGENPSLEVILYAAKLAAKHSKLNGVGLVDYCYRKNVLKIPKSKRAFVRYDEYKTINIK